METQAWNEIRRICDSANPVGISALSFDPYQELLWMGNDLGRVTSYYSTSLSKYTWYPAHSSQVRQIAMSDRGVLSISNDSIVLRNRRGVVQWRLGNSDTLGLHCLSHSPLQNSEVLVAGQREEMLVVNLNRGSIVRKVANASNIVVMKKSPRVICCGSMTGEISLRDPRTFAVLHSVQGHTGTLSDLDVQGTTLITCGFSLRQGSLIPDQLVKLYDIRMTLRSLPPIPFPAGPSLLKVHPKLSTTIFIASQSGQFQMCDINNISSPSSLQFYQAPTTSYINAIDCSSSGELLALADASSFVYLYDAGIDNAESPAKFNAYSSPIEMPDSVTRPNIYISDNTPMSVIGLPYYTETLLSGDWPGRQVYDISRQPMEIDPEILANMKMLDFVGYSPNLTGRLRNQVSTRKNPRKGYERPGVDEPKFRSEQAKELLFSSREQEDDLGDDIKEEVEQLEQWDPKQAEMPPYYRRVEIKYSRFGVEDFDFGFYNRTKFGGLETHIANSYTNSLLQVLFFTSILCSIAKSHICSPCPKENCLCCELGFLFRMLEQANGANCQATNFLRAFGTIPQAAALGLFEPDAPDISTSYSALIQNFHRFILEQLHQELNNPQTNPRLIKIAEADVTQSEPKGESDVDTPIPSAMQQVIGLQTYSMSKCESCGNEVTRTVYPFVVDLAYPSPKFHARRHSKSNSLPQSLSFSSLLQSSIHRETHTKAYCAQCQQYQPTTAKKVLKALPQVLAVNSGVANREQAEIWRGTEAAGIWLPSKLRISIEQELQITELDANNPNRGNGDTVAVYELTALVSQIQQEKDVPHLVAHIKVPSSELEQSSQSPWYLFNDFLVRKVSEQEAISFSGTWKTPAIVYYTRVDLNQQVSLDALPSQIDTTILFKDISVARSKGNLPKTHEILSEDEMPTPGTLVAIDAEFVALNQEETEIRSDGTKSVLRPSKLTLARVSVLRGANGEKHGVPFIDDYIHTSEPVVDYLTEFSGIQAGDLDPATSTHTLVPLKVAYKKLRLLVDLGCVFIGHGLKKDFRIINILVPPDQVIDTVDIYHIRNRQRKISLRFLAWYLLNEDIQKEAHDSIEDARTALLIYKKFLQYRNEGTFGKVLEDIYEAGRKANWLKPTKEGSTSTIGSKSTPVGYVAGSSNNFDGFSI